MKTTESDGYFLLIFYLMKDHKETNEYLSQSLKFSTQLMIPMFKVLITMITL